MNSDAVFKVLGFGMGAKVFAVLGGGEFLFAGGGVGTLRTVMPWEDKEDEEDAPPGSPVLSCHWIYPR